MAEHREKREYQRDAWLAAILQEKPPRSPPERVRVQATLYVHNLRDDDNAAGGLKWALDALRQKQSGDLRWREGIADLCGYFIDDDPGHLVLAKPKQVIDRLRPRLDLVVEAVE